MIQENELKQYMMTTKVAMDIEGFVCLYVTKAAISIIRLCRNWCLRWDWKLNRKKRHYHSYKGQIEKVAPNAINRNFSAERPNQKWATDVSQICIKDEKLYTYPILDMYNGEIITYTLSRSPNQRMVTDMLKKAFKKYKNLDGLLLHSDQGWHYQHTQY
mgnify:CR=1 FL=1